MGLMLKPRQTVFIDTAPLIYFFEDHATFAPLVARFLDEAFAKDVQLVTSQITYIEILTLPQRCGNERLAAKYREYLTNSERLSLYPLNVLVSEAAIGFRVAYNLKTPDAIQLGTAKVCGADWVLTNDRDWKAVTELSIVVLPEIGGEGKTAG